MPDLRVRAADLQEVGPAHRAGVRAAVERRQILRTEGDSGALERSAYPVERQQAREDEQLDVSACDRRMVAGDVGDPSGPGRRIGGGEVQLEADAEQDPAAATAHAATSAALGRSGRLLLMRLLVLGQHRDLLGGRG